MNAAQEKLRSRMKRAKEYNAERNRGLAAAGRCIGCSVLLQPESAGRKRCLSCIEKNRQSQARRRARNQEAGRCTECARQLPPDAGSAKCPACAAYARKTAIERNRKNRDHETIRVILTPGPDRQCRLEPEIPESNLRLRVEGAEIIAGEGAAAARYRMSERTGLAVRRAERDRQARPVIIILSKQKNAPAGRACRVRAGSQWEQESNARSG